MRTKASNRSGSLRLDFIYLSYGTELMVLKRGSAEAVMAGVHKSGNRLVMAYESASGHAEECHRIRVVLLLSIQARIGD